jgi:hypothetical protein
LLKALLLTITFFVFLFAGTFVWAKSAAAPMLVLDMRNAPQLPKSFRSVSDTLPQDINKTGLSDLHMAGGAQFSKSALSAIAQHLHAKSLVVIDLRQESHGMLNSNAVSWYGWHNAENAGKTPEQIEEAQADLLKALGEEKVAVVNNLIQKSPEGDIKKVKTIEYMVHQTGTEEKLVTEMGHRYKRLYVQDFHAPSDNQVDHFIEIMQALPKNKWVYFHCRAGVGRTTVFMAMNDILHNAKTVSLEDILARQVALGGRDLTDMPAKTSFKYRSSVERLNFIKQFYQYAHDNQDGYKTSWSDWVKTV